MKRISERSIIWEKHEGYAGDGKRWEGLCDFPEGWDTLGNKWQKKKSNKASKSVKFCQLFLLSEHKKAQVKKTSTKCILNITDY